jgi:hypothetical protein
MSHGDNWCMQYVRDSDKAWAQANYNGHALSIAFCTPSGAASGWSRSTWLSKGAMLQCAGRLAGELSRQFGIPRVQLTSSQAQGNSKGFCEHKNFGAGGGGHVDCGNGFPMDEIIRIANGGTTQPPVPQEDGNVTTAVAYDPEGNAHFACLGRENGSVYYWPPGWDSWGQIDSGQSGAKSGVGIAISKDWWVTITYVNPSNQVCTYHKKFNEGNWVFTNKGGQAR